MARTTIEIQYLGNQPHVLDLTIGPEQRIVHVFQGGLPSEKLNVTNIVSTGELNRSQQMFDLIQAGLYTVVVTPGADDIGEGLGGSVDLAIVAPPAVGATSVVGVSLRAARSDHTHAVPYAASVTTIGNAAVGTSTNVARQDHSHGIANFTLALRPAATTFSPGAMIFNTTSKIYNVSDGTNWYDNDGSIV